MLTPFAKLMIGATTDFIVTGGSALAGYMVANGAVVMPSPAMTILAVLLGAIGAAKHVQGMLSDPNK